SGALLTPRWHDTAGSIDRLQASRRWRGKGAVVDRRKNTMPRYLHPKNWERMLGGQDSRFVPPGRYTACNEFVVEFPANRRANSFHRRCVEVGMERSFRSWEEPDVEKTPCRTWRRWRNRQRMAT